MISKALRFQAVGAQCTQLFLQLLKCWVWRLCFTSLPLPSTLWGVPATCKGWSLCRKAKEARNFMDAERQIVWHSCQR